MARRRDQDGFDSRDAADLARSFQRLDPRTQVIVAVLLVIAGLVFAAAWFQSHNRTGGVAPPADYAQMLLGNPSNATDVASDRDNYLLTKPYYALSYNDSKGIPNWVSWQVISSDLGDSPRKQTFDTDTTLPAGFSPVTSYNYDKSGFDRGHMCPHGDRAANQEMSIATFVMTNIIPQAPNVNRKAWEQLESYCRELVSRDRDRLYIIAGPAGQGGRGSRGVAQTIGGGRVVVPAECWKIVVVLADDGGDDLAKISLGTRVIAVIMPNDQDRVDEDWSGFRTSPAEIEKATGLHFFDRVRSDIAAALREKVDGEPIPPPKPRHYAD
jgi:endonuclease G